MNSKIINNKQIINPNNYNYNKIQLEQMNNNKNNVN